MALEPYKRCWAVSPLSIVLGQRDARHGRNGFCADNAHVDAHANVLFDERVRL